VFVAFGRKSENSYILLTHNRMHSLKVKEEKSTDIYITFYYTVDAEHAGIYNNADHTKML
jgi:hypothetical protein